MFQMIAEQEYNCDLLNLLSVFGLWLKLLLLPLPIPAKMCMVYKEIHLKHLPCTL